MSIKMVITTHIYPICRIKYNFEDKMNTMHKTQRVPTHMEGWHSLYIILNVLFHYILKLLTE